ncbi:MAG: adenine phosphoribosyltransferase [Oscillospiraceae bacterium]|jgi:adenine phosphoribosyltransferase|nr:adenine phosphoribosyltransferase [Oscillospiraceae bacterium]
MKYYNMSIAGCQRSLPICQVNEHLDIAAFIMLGDVEITQKCAEELLKICPEFDLILTAEAKGIPLAHELARQSGKPYLVGRKGKKLYMTEPLEVKVKSITTDKVQTLYLSCEEAAKLEGKRVLIADDVISTGESLLALERLVELAGGKLAGKAAVLAEGEAANRKDISYLEALPLFFK